MASAAPKPAQEANLFELSCGRISVTYSTTSFIGQPQFSYRDPNLNLNFVGDQIQVEKTSIGRLVSVTLEVIPDLRTVTFTVVLPVVRVLAGSAGMVISVPGVRTTHHTTIAGPPPLGPDKTYEVCELKGTAQLVAF